MTNDLFGGFGGLMKGLSSLMPQDDPAVKLLNAQTEVTELRRQEMELYAEIGKRAVEIYGLDSFGDIADRLRLVQGNLSAAGEKLDCAKAEQEAEERAKKEAMEAEEKARQEVLEACLCPSCGYENPEGTKFCQECGTKLGAAGKRHCTSCGAELAPGTRFCGECGAKQEV